MTHFLCLVALENEGKRKTKFGLTKNTTKILTCFPSLVFVGKQENTLSSCKHYFLSLVPMSPFLSSLSLSSLSLHYTD